MITTASSTETSVFRQPVHRFLEPQGDFKERLKKRQLKLLESFAPLLKQFQEPGEEVLLAMHGCSPMSFMEAAHLAGPSTISSAASCGDGPAHPATFPPGATTRPATRSPRSGTATWTRFKTSTFLSESSR